MTNRQPGKSIPGVEASLAELLRVRPGSGLTGFAPGGRVSTHQFGVNRSVFRGRGIEFDEARIYQPGDEIRAIDWRVTARTGSVHTKLFHEERERPVLVLVDCRGMMQFGSRLRFKSVLAAQVAAMLSWVGIDGGDRVGGFVLDRHGMQDFAASRKRSDMLTFFSAICAATCVRDPRGDGGTEVSLQYALRRLRHVCRPGTLVFIVSDYDDFDELAETEIKRLSLHAQVTNILVYDHLDEALPERGDYRVSDGAAAFALPGLGKTRLRGYQQAFRARRDRLEKLSRQRRMAFMALRTDADPKTILTPHRRQPRQAARVEIAA